MITPLFSSLLSFFFFLMIRRPPRATRTDTLLPYTTLFRSTWHLVKSGTEGNWSIPKTGLAHSSVRPCSRHILRQGKEHWPLRTSELAGHQPCLGASASA